MKGWFGVVQELQRSPHMQLRHASIETAMRTPSPIAQTSVRLHKMMDDGPENLRVSPEVG